MNNLNNNAKRLLLNNIFVLRCANNGSARWLPLATRPALLWNFLFAGLVIGL
jgi:hypothetical protein